MTEFSFLGWTIPLKLNAPLKGIVRPKLKISPWVAHPRAILGIYDFLLSYGYNQSNVLVLLSFIMAVNGGQDFEAQKSASKVLVRLAYSLQRSRYAYVNACTTVSRSWKVIKFQIGIFLFYKRIASLQKFTPEAMWSTFYDGWIKEESHILYRVAWGNHGSIFIFGWTIALNNTN